MVEIGCLMSTLKFPVLFATVPFDRYLVSGSLKPIWTSRRSATELCLCPQTCPTTLFGLGREQVWRFGTLISPVYLIGLLAGRLCNNLSLFLVVVACLTVLLSYSWQPLGLPTSFDNLFWEEDLPSYLDDAILDADYAADFEYPDSREPGEPFEYSDIVEGTELASPAPAGSE